MALLDPLFRFFAGLRGGLDRVFETITNPQIGDEQATDQIGQAVEETTPADEVAAALVDLVEEAVLSNLEDTGEITPENVEETADQTEGAAVAVLAGLGLAGSAVEAASLGQIDQQQEYITQALAGLGVNDVTGTELEARLQEGIKPAQEARAAKEHRAQFVNLQDAVELALRNKQADQGYLTPENAPPRVQQLIGSNDPVNPNNLVEEWGLRDDQLPILEEVALESMEFEELIETPAELGLVVPEDVLELVLDLAGYPEELKDFLRQVPDEIPRSNRAWEERTAVEPLVAELEPLVRRGEVSPAAARELLPEEVDVAAGALEDRFENLQEVPTPPPNRSQVESSFSRGYSDLETLLERLDRLEYDTERYSGVWKAAVLDQLDGDLQEALALGLVSTNEFTNLCQEVGLDQAATNALLRGETLSDITKRRLQEDQDQGAAPVGAIQGIGEARATSLQTIGVETVEDLAAADPEEVADVAQVSPETARDFIDLAAGLTE